MVFIRTVIGVTLDSVMVAAGDARATVTLFPSDFLKISRGQ